MNKKHIIGIIGGAGVAATNKLQELIEVQLTQSGAFRDVHHPELIVWQATQAPSRSMYLEGKGDSFIPRYVDIAKRLKACGATKLCMCCNTAHYAIDEISKQADISFINLVEICVKKVKTIGVSSVGLVASDGCLQGNVYEKYFKIHIPDVKIIYPDIDYQKMVTQGICNTKNKHRFDTDDSEDNPKNIFKKIKNHLLNNGAEIVICGCTDIRAVYYEYDNIDSLEMLKEAIINYYNKNLEGKRQ